MANIFELHILIVSFRIYKLQVLQFLITVNKFTINTLNLNILSFIFDLLMTLYRVSEIY